MTPGHFRPIQRIIGRTFSSFSLEHCCAVTASGKVVDCNDDPMQTLKPRRRVALGTLYERQNADSIARRSRNGRKERTTRRFKQRFLLVSTNKRKLKSSIFIPSEQKCASSVLARKAEKSTFPTSFRPSRVSWNRPVQPHPEELNEA